MNYFFKNYPDLGSCKIGIIGMGYVGLPLAVSFANQKICAKTNKNLSRFITGYDISEKRINELKNGFDTTNEIDNLDLLKSKSLYFTSIEEDIYESDVFIVTVPTPIDKNNNPNLTFLVEASKLVGRALKKRASNIFPLVIYESTVYPGATEEICIPKIEENSQLKINIDFFCGYSPERINPGDKKRRLEDVVKVTSGSNNESSFWINQLYASIIKAGTHKASSIKVAEAAKVIENTQRDLNIALINELAIIFNELNLDTNDIIDVASSKWNFQDFRPGLVGGHCIGVDPYYLTFKSKSVGYYPELVLAGRRINENMSKWIIEKLVLKLIAEGIKVKNAETLVLGFSFKENCPDIRNTKTIDIIKNLEKYNINPTIVDPLADKDECKRIFGIELKNNIPNKKYDIIIVTVGHDEFKIITSEKWSNLKNNNGIFLDLKNIIPRNLDPMRI